jgi:hypothetical protein
VHVGGASTSAECAASPRRHIKLQPHLKFPSVPANTDTFAPLPSSTLLIPQPPLPSTWRIARSGTDTRALHTSLEPTPAVKLEQVSRRLLPATVRLQHPDMERLLRPRMGHLRRHTERQRQRMEHQLPRTGSPQPKTQMRSASSSGR